MGGRREAIDMSTHYLVRKWRRGVAKLNETKNVEKKVRGKSSFRLFLTNAFPHVSPLLLLWPYLAVREFFFSPRRKVRFSPKWFVVRETEVGRGGEEKIARRKKKKKFLSEELLKRPSFFFFPFFLSGELLLATWVSASRLISWEKRRREEGCLFFLLFRAEQFCAVQWFPKVRSLSSRFLPSFPCHECQE